METKIIDVEELGKERRENYLFKIAQFMVENEVEPKSTYSMMKVLYSPASLARVKASLFGDAGLFLLSMQHWFAAVRGHEIVGAIMMNPNSDISEFTIASFFVKPENRGQGIGTLMLNTCINYLENEGGIKTLMTDSLIDARMISFFIRHGFNIIPDEGKALTQRQKDAQAFLSATPTPPTDIFILFYHDVIKTGGIVPVIWLGKDLAH